MKKKTVKDVAVKTGEEDVERMNRAAEAADRLALSARNATVALQEFMRTSLSIRMG
jgi:hypothetical protein